MDKSKLEYYLSKDNVFGFNTKNDTLHIGWVLLEKRTPVNKFFERFIESDDPILFKTQLDILNNPYRIHIAEVTKEVYDSDKFPTNKDFLVNKNYKFTNLDEVEIFLSSMGLVLGDIKWGTDVLFL